MLAAECLVEVLFSLRFPEDVKTSKGMGIQAKLDKIFKDDALLQARFTEVCAACKVPTDAMDTALKG